MKPEDLPPEIREAIEKAAKEGVDIVFVGLLGDLPEPLKRALALELKRMATFTEGQCIDCQKQMPNWPPTGKGWLPPEGWFHYRDKDGDPCAWQCPECDRKEQPLSQFEPSRN